MDTNWDFEAQSRTYSARQTKFAEIRAAINAILEEAIATAPVQDAVNYGDLKCSNIEQVFSESGNDYYRVCIDEAAPDAWKFQHWILEQLNKRGLPAVLVSTEW